jgi:hypothetical protein
VCCIFGERDNILRSLFCQFRKMEELHIDAGHELLDRLEVELGLPNSRGDEKKPR